MQYNQLLETCRGRPLIQVFPELAERIERLAPHAAFNARMLFNAPTEGPEFDAGDLIELRLLHMLLTPQACTACGGTHLPVDCWPPLTLSPETSHETGWCPDSRQPVKLELVYARSGSNGNVMEFRLSTPPA